MAKLANHFAIWGYPGYLPTFKTGGLPIGAFIIKDSFISRSIRAAIWAGHFFIRSSLIRSRRAKKLIAPLS